MGPYYLVSYREGTGSSADKSLKTVNFRCVYRFLDPFVFIFETITEARDKDAFSLATADVDMSVFLNLSAKVRTRPGTLTA